MSYLRFLQLKLQREFNRIASTNKAIIIVMINSALVASSNKNCVENLLDPDSVEQIVFNSVAILLLVDVRLLNFIKLFLSGGISYVLTSEFISIHAKYVSKLECKLPISIEGNFNIFIVALVFTLTIFWIFTGNEAILKEDKEILDKIEKERIMKDKDFYD
jgi:hypothetical protein